MRREWFYAVPCDMGAGFNNSQVGDSPSSKILTIKISSEIADKLARIRDNFYLRTGHKPTQLAVTPLEALELECYLNHSLRLPSKAPYTFMGMTIVVQTTDGIILTDHDLIVAEAYKESLEEKE